MVAGAGGGGAVDRCIEPDASVGMPIEEPPVVVRYDDVSVHPHPGVGAGDALDVKEGAHGPVQFDVLVEGHQVARNANPSHGSVKQHHLGAGAVASQQMYGYPIRNAHVPIHELEAITNVEQIEGEFRIVVEGRFKVGP